MKASDNIYPKVIHSMQTSDQSAPSDSSWKTYAKADGIYARSSNGIVGPFGTATTFTAAGSNSKDVSGRSYAGASTTLLAPFDHEHLGVSAVTSSSSNTLARPVVNFRAGPNIGLAASDSNGDGVLDTVTIVGSGSGSGSGSITAYSAVQSADLTIPNTNTYTDVTGASVSLPAGDYVGTASFQLQNGAGADSYIGIRVSDGTTDYAIAKELINNNLEDARTLTIKKFTLGGTTTVKLQAASGGTGNKVIKVPTTLGGSGVIATCLSLLKIG